MSIPHIYAKSDTDAFFGVGYAHAQDRLFQIDMQRRLAAGRLSELVGETALPLDRFFRTLGFRFAIQSLSLVARIKPLTHDTW
jgi:penicillin amidase